MELGLTACLAAPYLLDYLSLPELLLEDKCQQAQLGKISEQRKVVFRLENAVRRLIGYILGPGALCGPIG